MERPQAQAVRGERAFGVNTDVNDALSLCCALM
jgi:hypothetical protein